MEGKLSGDVIIGNDNIANASDYDENLWRQYVLWYSQWLKSNTNDTITEHFLMPPWRISLWATFFGSLVIASFAGNGIVIWTVLSDKKMRTVTNYLLVNLAVSDTMLSTLNTTFSFVSMVTHNWPFGSVMCTVAQYVAVFSVACSSFTLVAISIERYFAIVHPLRKRMSKLATLVCVSIVWLMSLLIALPHAIYASLDLADDGNRHICHLYWPDGSTFDSLQEFAYNVVLTLATYVIPMSVISFMYTRVGRKLWGSTIIGEATEQQLGIMRSKRKIVRMLIIVVVIFATCWLPYHIYFLVSWLYRPTNEWKYIQEVYLAIYWLAMSSSMYNPFIYCWMNSKFRLGFTKIFCGCCSSNVRKLDVSTITH